MSVSKLPNKLICFRFDVDTPLCIGSGVPALVALAKEHRVKFTFFFNMGHSVSRWDQIRDLLSRRNKNAGIQIRKLSSLEKLGLRRYLEIATFNSKVGCSNPECIVQAFREGHEIGLHGGKNHGLWQRHAQAWTSDRLYDEIRWGKTQLERILGENVASFSSPGWNGSALLNEILAELGFKYAADIHSSKTQTIGHCGNGKVILTVPTNLVGEPGGVGYLEWLSAQGLGFNDSLRQFEKNLESFQKLAVLYDHPCYAGTKAIELVGSIVDLAKKKGFEVVTIHEAVDRKRAHGQIR